MTDREIDELFVRKDLYDANSARLEALMRANVAEHKAISSELRGEVVRLEDKFFTSQDAIDKRISDLKEETSKGFSRQNILLVSMQIVIAVIFYFLTR